MPSRWVTGPLNAIRAQRGVRLLRRAERSSSISELSEATELLRRVIETTPAGHPDLAARISSLGDALLARYRRSGSVADLDEAIAARRRSVTATPGDHSGRPARVSNLAVALWNRFQRLGSMADLDEAIVVGREAVAATREGDPGRAVIWSNLGAALTNRFERSGSVADLEEAIAVGRQAVAAVPGDDRDRIFQLSNLSAVLLAGFSLSGSVADLEEAVAISRRAVAATAEDNPDRAGFLLTLGSMLHGRFERSGSLADLDESIAADRQAVAAVPPDDPDLAHFLSNLGVGLWDRFQRSGSVADLREAIDVAREAVAATPDDHAYRGLYLSNLGAALHEQFDRSGSLADLDDSINAYLQSVTVTPGDHLGRALYLSNLSTALHDRFDVSGSLTDLEQAITVARQAVAATPADHAARPTQLSNLGSVLWRRFERSGSVPDLEEAVTVSRQAVAATPDDHPDRARWLSNLSTILQDQFAESGSLADLEEAITVCRQAIAATPGDHPDRAIRLSNLGGVLRARFDRSGSLADLREAIASSRQALSATPIDHPDRAIRLSNLGAVIRIRFEQSRSEADFDEAIASYRQAAGTHSAQPRVRLTAATVWGSTAASDGRWTEAATGYETAVGLLGLVTPRSLARTDQEHVLGNLAGLASNTAACCIRAGRPDRAVELLELGRAVLLGQALDIRTDLTSLAERRPDLAEQFSTLRNALDELSLSSASPPRRLEPGNLSAAAPSDSWPDAEQRRATASAFDRVLTQIRDEPEFADFLRPMPVSELRTAAAHGPVAIVNISDFGSHALILTAGGVLEPVPLGNVTPDDVNRQVAELIACFRDHQRLADLNTRLAAILHWLWEAIARPVLDCLGFTERPAVGRPWPRLWWCLPGLMSFLPLHAAGDHETRTLATPQTVIDRVISSYTPTIRALAHVRRSRPDAADLANDALVVALPHTPGASDLPGAETEARKLRQRLGPGVTVLTGRQATRDAVVQNLRTARWAHFACHGAADLTSPSASHLLLADHQRLAVTDIARLDLFNADMAYLSACSTAQPGVQLADEAIHLASAFHLAGYRNVIGTLWPVNDHAAVTIADQIYATLTRSSAGAGQALHSVTRSLRDLKPGLPSTWASHVHIGP